MLTNHSAAEHWCCFACLNNPHFTTEKLFVQHLRSAHQDTITNSQISGLKSASKVAIQDKIASCPICDWPHGDSTISHDELMNHIAKDIHNFSLRALPWAGDDGNHYCNTATKEAGIHGWLSNLPKEPRNTWWKNGTTAIFNSKWYTSVASYLTSSATTMDTREALDIQEADREPNYFDDIKNPYFSQQPPSITESEAGSNDTAVKALESLRQEQDGHDNNLEPVRLGEQLTANSEPDGPNSVERSNGESLLKQLMSGTIAPAMDGLQYIPLDVLNKVITVDSITKNLRTGSKLWAYYWSDKLPRQICRHAMKVFAILVLVGKKPAIEDLMNDGLTDKNLRLSRKDNIDVLVSEAAGREFVSFERWSSFHVEAFLQKQWRVLAPVLEHVGQQLVLDENCPLPLLDGNKEGIYEISGSLIRMARFHKAHCSEALAVSTYPILSSVFIV